MDKARIGVIGGSGVYHVDQLKNIREVKLETPFGSPSDAYVLGEIEGIPVAFLPRHGKGHRISPTRVNARANIFGFKLLGVEYIISANACGSLQPEYKVSDIVVPDQVFDRTRWRKLSFFDDPEFGTDGCAVHVAMADPFCAYLNKVCADAVEQTGHKVHRGGSFVIIEGPRFSTRAESKWFKAMGFAIVGMTTIPEVFLAREAGMSYSVIAHVTDYDCWHESEEHVTTEMVIQRLQANAEVAKCSIVNAIRMLKNAPPTPYADVLKDAIITDRQLIPDRVKYVLAPIVGKYL